MNSFDFLRKLYRTSKSAVMIVNTANTIFWSTNLDKIGTSEFEVKSNIALKFFGKMPYQLYPGEYIATIKEKCFTYNVKSFADRTNEFIIIEIRTECISHSVVNSKEMSDLLGETSFKLKRNTGDIMAVIDKVQSNNGKLTNDDYSNILNSARCILNSNRNISSIIEMKNEIEGHTLDNINISELTSKFAEDCEKAFKNKNIEIVLNCVENIYGSIGSTSFNNLCLSVLNRILCITDGYIDKIIVGLEMISDNTVELYISTESPSGNIRISNLEELQEKLNKKDALGTDLFAIRYFCEKFHAEATQKINHEDHSTSISVKIPRCTSQGIMLFRCSETLPEEKFSKISIALADVIPNIN